MSKKKLKLVNQNQKCCSTRPNWKFFCPKPHETTGYQSERSKFEGISFRLQSQIGFVLNEPENCM